MTDFTLNDLQRAVIGGLRRRDTIIAARCGWGSGKTTSLIFALWFVAKTRPGTTSLLITDTTPRYNSVLMPEIEKWLAPRGWVYNHTLHKWTDTHSGSSVICRSYYRPGTRDASHNPLEGINVTSGVAFIDECQTLGPEVAHKALGRLRSGPSPTLVLVGLPVVDAWWCKMAEQAGHLPLLFSSYVNQYRPEMTGRIAIDWGFRKPAVVIMAYDEALDATVVIKEINPQEVTVDQLARLILAVAWPRAHQASAPGPRIWLDTGVADKAGHARNDQTGRSAFAVLSRPIDEGGIGLPLRSTTDPVRVDILNGVQKLKRALARKQYLMTREAWEAGERALGNSLRKALLSYAWDTTEQPKKDGREDPLDALRYDCIFHYWADVVGRYQSRATTLDKSRRNARPSSAVF